MGNKEKLREWERQREVEHRRQVIATPRHYNEGLQFPGVGRLCMRVLLMPPWEPLCCWEIRQTDRLVAYRSDAVEGSPGLVVGFTPLAIPLDELAARLRDIMDLQLPPMVENIPYAVLDGTSLAVRFEGDMGWSSQFRWIQGEAPSGWALLETHTLSLISRFRSAGSCDDAD
jgi:hypothetical protein